MVGSNYSDRPGFLSKLPDQKGAPLPGREIEAGTEAVLIHSAAWSSCLNILRLSFHLLTLPPCPCLRRQR